LYTVTGVVCVGDITFDPDDSFSPEWEAHLFDKLVKLFHQLPFPLASGVDVPNVLAAMYREANYARETG